METFRILLRDINAKLVEAWKRAFMADPEVDVSLGDIFAGVPVDAIVSPANSFGFMDGGIDAVYSRRFGWDLQDRLQAVLKSEHDGELPVGDALIIETRDAALPYVVSAPTMRVPGDVSDTVNAYLAFRASLRAVKAFNRNAAKPIRSLLCPGLGTAVGKMSPERCAHQMHVAYEVCMLGQTWSPKTWPESVRDHDRLLL
jgi:O-acetyl-ADP-ribose deacetylase (regulator of RNase III)